MDWQDEGIVLGVRAHGEGGGIVEALTLGHGRHLGLVHGIRTRRGGRIQPGDTVKLAWRARLADHLGHFTLEVTQTRVAAVLDDGLRLAALQSVLATTASALPEREPHPAVCAALAVVLDAIAEAPAEVWAPAIVRFEAGLLADLGYGLDLSSCAATGALEDLVYVSPRSGRAVSREAGAPYAPKLLALPAFLLGSQAAVTPGDVHDGFRLTGHFLDHAIYLPQGKPAPDARARLIDRLVLHPL